MKKKITGISFLVIAALLALTMSDLSAQESSIADPNQSLLISDGSQFVLQKLFPKFSWETTPMYYMFGATARVLSPDEVEFIAARTDFLCI